MSPEQLTGSGELDGRSDLYSLGCMLYEMLAGQPPFTGPTLESLANQHAYLTPRPVSELRPGVPAGVVVALQRALAKSPAARFETAAGFGEALRRSEVATMSARASERAGSRVTGAPAAPRGRRTWWLAAGAACVLALGSVAAWQGWGPFANGQGGTAAPPKQHWILVAEFEGPPDDSTVAPAARSLVSAALDQSGFLATVPGEQIQLALQQAGKPANTRVSAEVARELAYRRSVRAVLEGDVARIGQGYSVVLRVVDAESLRVVLTERTSARNADALIPAIGRLAEKLRRDLGERQSAIVGTRAMAEVATPSFEAYRLYVQASRIGQSGDYPGAIAVGRETLRLDPDFAMAWSMLGAMYLNLGQADSAVAAWDEARRRPQRLTTIQRVLIDAHRARAEGNPEQAVEYYSRRLQLSPNSPVALNSLANTLSDVGRFEEALARYEESERYSPFGAGPIVVGNRIICLLSLGRVEQARELARPLPGIFGIIRRTEVELAACNWAMAESMATAEAMAPATTTLRPMGAAFRLAQAQAGRGSLQAARATLSRSIQLAEGSPLMQVSAGRVLLHLAAESRGGIEVPNDMLQADNSAAAVLFRGLRAAVMGNEVAARRGLKLVRGRSGLEAAAQKGALLLLEAKLAALAGRWDEVVRVLQPVASQSADLIPSYAADYSVGLPIARCILADAFEKLGAPDSAAAYLERMTTDPNAGMDWPGAVQPLAHWRLSMLYARTGRIADAARHLAVLERWWDRPDDVARRMLDEARAAVRAARPVAAAYAAAGFAASGALARHAASDERGLGQRDDGHRCRPGCAARAVRVQPRAEHEVHAEVGHQDRPERDDGPRGDAERRRSARRCARAGSPCRRGTRPATTPPWDPSPSSGPTTTRPRSSR